MGLIKPPLGTIGLGDIMPYRGRGLSTKMGWGAGSDFRKSFFE
jgi:hypothetical protein